MEIIKILFISILTSMSWAELVSICFDEKKQIFTPSFSSHFAADTVARSYYNNEVNETGWAFLNIYTSDQAHMHSDESQAYAAGWVEGYATRDLIAMHWQNTYKGYCGQPLSDFCSKLKSYLDQNTKWVQMKVDQYPNDPYWTQVKLFYYQYSGLIDGYYNRTGSPRIMSDIDDLFLLQIGGDLEDLSSALKKPGFERLPGNGHCSALVKLLANNSDLYVAQDTWTGYNEMLRILKKYELRYSGVNTMTFSSQPGLLMSGDDFYVLDNGMVTMETTIGNGNGDLWKYVHPEYSVLEGIRSLVANRLAKNGAEWTEIFSRYNSGTYNNQWMVVDYRQFTPGHAPREGLLYVAEQIPGMIISKDLTELLKNQSYFGSYNIPYFPEIFNASGGPAMVEKYGDWFTYEHGPRANIFRRDHVKVTDTTSMTRLMRYNDFENDPLSSCNCTPPYSAENAISARSDLNPANGTYAFGALGHRLHGGVDMKLTTFTLHKTQDFIAVSSPTYDDQPPFQWSKSDFQKKVSHIGHPDLWKFDPIQTKWSSLSEE